VSNLRRVQWELFELFAAGAGFRALARRYGMPSGDVQWYVREEWNRRRRRR
jgi:hypothetical protein